MDLKEVYKKLDVMSEQISKLRESSARTEAFLLNLPHVQAQIDELKTSQNKFKGGVVVVSALFSAATAVIVKILLK